MPLVHCDRAQNIKTFDVQNMSEDADGEQNMRIDPQRAATLAENLSHVWQRVEKVAGGRKVRAYPIRTTVLS